MVTSMLESPESRTVQRGLTARMVITGELMLVSPAHFGNGDESFLVDLPLLADEVDQRAIITGASLAGALRNYLREREFGYSIEGSRGSLAAKLFGGERGDEDGDQSPLIVDDALGEVNAHQVAELRDGVSLDPASRTAEDDKKFDYHVLPAGTRFPLRLELLLGGDNAKNECRKRALVLALSGLERGEIRLGARKRRGLGRCKAGGWSVAHYDLRKPAELLAWLAAEHSDWGNGTKPTIGESISDLLGIPTRDMTDQRRQFKITARFIIDGSIMVRSRFQERGPDHVHFYVSVPATETDEGIQVATPSDPTPTLPGTSATGAIRHRALRIVQTISSNGKGSDLVNRMFGPAVKKDEQPWASPVVIEEQSIQGGHTLVQSRIRIDRFSGGAADSALFDEAPHFGGEVSLDLTLRLPPIKAGDASAEQFEQAQMGLLLLVLKDLWTGDLPIGGEASVGRGRLQGQHATVRFPTGEAIKVKRDPITAEFVVSEEEARRVNIEKYVAALHRELQGETP